MATHSRILTWRIPMDRRVWPANSPWGHKESDTTARLNTQIMIVLLYFYSILVEYLSVRNRTWILPSFFFSLSLSLNRDIVMTL